MGKILIIAKMLISALFLIGLCYSQGVGNSNIYDQNGYDWMGTPVISTDQANIKMTMPDYLNPYTSQRPEWDPYGPGVGPQLGRPEWDPFGAGSSAFGLLLEPADPMREGLSIGGGLKLANQLYIQSGSQLLTQGVVKLGEPYTLWARVTGKGSFLLYNYNRLVLNQGYVTPGWYKIKGAYADFLGQNLYRFASAGFESNNLSLIVDRGTYPTSLSLTGRVVNQYGQGMPGVKVIVSNNDGGRFSTMTVRDGYYAIDVATGVYLVNAELPGYVFTQSMVQVMSGFVSAARPVVGTPVDDTSSFVRP